MRSLRAMACSPRFRVRGRGATATSRFPPTGARQHRVAMAAHVFLRRVLSGSSALVVAALLACGCARGTEPAAPAPQAGPGTSAPAPAPAPKQRVSKLESRLLAWEQADREQPPAPGGIVFLGSSTIEFWTTIATDFPGQPVVARGVGGCTLRQVAAFAPRALGSQRPRLVVLYAGENDLASKRGGPTPEQVAADFDLTVKAIRGVVPTCRIVFLGIKPSPSRTKKHDAFAEANRLIAARCAAGENLRFVDTAPAVAGPDGEVDLTLFRRDRLHLNEAGYARLAELLRPVLTAP